MATVNIPLGASIQAAIDANPAGTTFQLAAGTYRGEQFEPQSNDQFIGDPSGGTVLSGAIVLSNWSQSGGYWVDGGLPASYGTSASGSSPGASDLNDLFVNNTLYTRVSSLSQVTSGTWYFDPSTNSAVISDNPSGKTVEYSVTPTMTVNNGATGVVFQNLSTVKYATDAQIAPISAGTNWQINNVTSTGNHGAGLLIAAGDVVQGGHFNQNGQVGIEGGSANGAKVLNAEIANNNYAGYNVQWDAGGLKAGSTANLTVSGDNVHNNNGNGVWSDVDCSSWTITNNTIDNNQYNGIHLELSHGPTSVTNNTISDNSGSGIYVSNTDGVTASNNTITVNPGNSFNNGIYAAGGGIDVINNSGRGSDSSGVPYQSYNDTITNNIINHPGDSTEDGIFTAPGEALPGNANDVFNSNTYNTTNANGTYWHFNNTDYTWNSLRQSGTFESSGTDNVGQVSATSASTSPTDPSTSGSTPASASTADPTAAATIDPTAVSTAVPTPSSSGVTIPADQGNATVSQSQISVTATSGDHMLLISGSGDSVNLSGGSNTITDSSGGNTFVLPPAGQGTDTFTSDILQQGDTLDLTSALAATSWDGSSSTLSQYLHLDTSAQGVTLSIASASGGAGVPIATIEGGTVTDLPTFLGHAIT